MVYQVKTEGRTEIFSNLDQVYGYCVGLSDTYRHHHPSIKFFRRWYAARCRRGIGDDPFDYGKQVEIKRLK